MTTPTCHDCHLPINETPVTMPFGQFLHIKCYTMRGKEPDDTQSRFLRMMISGDIELLKEVIDDCLSNVMKRQILHRYNIEMLTRKALAEREKE